MSQVQIQKFNLHIEAKLLNISKGISRKTTIANSDESDNKFDKVTNSYSPSGTSIINGQNLCFEYRKLTAADESCKTSTNLPYRC